MQVRKTHRNRLHFLNQDWMNGQYVFLVLFFVRTWIKGSFKDPMKSTETDNVP